MTSAGTPPPSRVRCNCGAFSSTSRPSARSPRTALCSRCRIPIRRSPAPPLPCQSLPHPAPSLAVLAVSEWKQDGAWVPLSGRAQLVVTAPLEGLHAGDEVELTGRLSAPQPPANPGEEDGAGQLRDNR